MRYLPDPSNASFQPFWKRLVDKVQSLLESTPVLRSRGEGPLRLIKSLRLLHLKAKDKDGNPLWDDIDPPCYLSPMYSSGDLIRLQSYGLRWVDMGELLARAERDLNSPSSRMKASKDEDWHSRAARMLAVPFIHNYEFIKPNLRVMAWIPLQNGQWISANSGPTYYASSAGVQIPKDLGLNLIDPTAAKNADRKILFDYLGATEASTDHVRQLILDRFRSTDIVDAASVSLQTSRNHLEYLYLTHPREDVVVPLAFHSIFVFTQEEVPCWPYRIDVYKPDNDEYGAKQLLKRTPPGPDPGSGAPGLSVPFLHQVYLDGIPDKPAGHSLSWTDFLHRYLNVQKGPRLICNPTQESASLSEITHYLQRYRPELFLPVFHYYWPVEGQKIATKSSVVAEMRAMEVLCRRDCMTPLSLTYLPTPSLERLQARYMVDQEVFPFLKLPFPPNDDAESDPWEFLHTTFKVGRYDDLVFYLIILHCILSANKQAENVVNSPRVYGVYGRIQATLLACEVQSMPNGEIMYVKSPRDDWDTFSHVNVCQKIFREKIRHFHTRIPWAMSGMGSTEPMPLGWPAVYAD